MRAQHQILNNIRESYEEVDSKFNKIIIMLAEIQREITNEKLKGQLANLTVELFNIQSEIYRESKLNEDIDFAKATPEEIDDYYFDRLSDEAKNAETAQEKFKLTCAATAADFMSAISDEVGAGYFNMLVNQAKTNYRYIVSNKDRDKYSDEDFKNQILSEFRNNGKDIKILEEAIYESNINE